MRKRLLCAVAATALVTFASASLEVDPNRWTAWRHLLGGIP